MEDKLLYCDEVYAIQGALFDVYKTMGNMWGEDVYQQCLEKELALLPLSDSRSDSSVNALCLKPRGHEPCCFFV